MQVLKDFSRVVGTEPVLIYPALHPLTAMGTPEATGGLSHLRIWNISAVTIWLSRSGQAARAAPGSYPLQPGEKEEHEAALIPLEALSAVAEAAGAALTVELRHQPRIYSTAAETQP